MQPMVANANRVALIIGNANYSQAALDNPTNDARDMAAKLKQLNFQVDQRLDANARTMKQAIRDFGKKLNQQGTVGLFYFAGHGVQVNGANYLIPIGANIESEADIEFEAVNAARILSQMSLADNGLNLMILDACRNNPFSRSFRSASRGLAKMHAPKGTVILYATSPGDVAADGSGKNGLFTEKLMQAMEKKGLKIEDVFKQTAIAVSQASANKQVPYFEGVILGDFYFNAKVSIKLPIKQPEIAVPGANVNNMHKYENRFWDSVIKMDSREMYEAYLLEYPRGHYTRIAKIKLKQLTKISQPPSTVKSKPKLKLKPESEVQLAKLTVRSNVKGDNVKINGFTFFFVTGKK